MRILEGFKMRTLGKERIIVGEGLERINFNKMIVLNESAAYLWESVIGREFDAQSLSDLLQERYDVDEETALKDSQAIAAKWLEAGIAAE